MITREDRLPKRLQTAYQSVEPHYTWSDRKGATRRDLVTAGFTETEAWAALLNSYSKKPMKHTLIIPEEWFWTARSWWGEQQNEPWLEKCYNLAGGSFCALPVEAQAAMFGIRLSYQTARKGPGNTWFHPDGRKADIARVLRSRLIEQGWDMAPAHPPSLDLFVKYIAKAEMGWMIGFGDRIEDARKSMFAMERAFKDILSVWQMDPSYFSELLNGFRRIEDIDREFISEMLRVGGLDFHRSMLAIFYHKRTYMNEMQPPNLPPLFGVKDERIRFFWPTYHANLNSCFSGFMRDYALPLKLDVAVVQMVKASAA